MTVASSPIMNSNRERIELELEMGRERCQWLFSQWLLVSN